MSRTRARFSSIVRQLGICIAVAAALSTDIRSANAVVVISDGFGDADLNNNGIAAELNDSDAS